MLPGAVCGAVAMMITLLLLLGASWLMAAGKLPAEREELLVMLCVFLGLALGVALMRPGRGENRPAFGAACFAVYVLILICMELSAGAERLFSGNMLKLCLCAGVGTLLGITLKSGHSGRSRRRDHRR